MMNIIRLHTLLQLDGNVGDVAEVPGQDEQEEHARPREVGLRQPGGPRQPLSCRSTCAAPSPATCYRKEPLLWVNKLGVWTEKLV